MAAQQLRAVIYVRVSTEDQVLEGQLGEVKKYVRARGWKLAGVFSDKESGASSTRPGYVELLHAAALNRFDLVVVWAIDRFGRSLVELLQALERLEQYGVKFASVRESHIDTTRPEGKLMLELLAVFAQFERRRMSSRTKVGVAEWRRKHGGQWGPSRKGPTVDQVLELLEAGFGKRAAARQLNCSESLVRKRLAEAAHRRGTRSGPRRRAPKAA